MYVDDFLWVGTELFEKQVVKKICSVIQIGSVLATNFRYIGLDIKETPGGITLDQILYASSLERLEISGQRLVTRESELSKKRELRIAQL